MSALDELRAALGSGSVADDPDVTRAYSFDHTAFLEAGRPLAVVMPSSTEEVVAVMRIADSHGIPVVTRGAGTGLAGGANAIDDCIILSVHRMNRILGIDRANRLAVAQPGVITGDLRRAVAAEGLFYPPDPGSVDISTIGGNAATDAGGLCCVKYGVTSRYVKALEVVLADGRVLHTGGTTVKRAAGYDLTHLLVGSEGTLGVITEVTVALLPAAPHPPATVVAEFDDLVRAGDAVARVRTAGLTPSLMELMDRSCVRYVNDYLHSDLADRAAILMAQSDAGPRAAEEAGRIEQLFLEAGAAEVYLTDDPDEGDMLLAARRSVASALEAQGNTLVDDVCVPVDRLADFIAAATTLGERFPLVKVAMVAHAGDGNTHPTVIWQPGDDDQRREAEEAFDAIMELGLSFGGTITGEHGIGTLKRGWLGQELGPVSTAVHWAVKDALDPKGLLNPGKGIPERPDRPDGLEADGRPRRDSEPAPTRPSTGAGSG